VVGAGDIGSAVARYQGFANRGFRVTMVFDNDHEKIGTKVGEYTVEDYQTIVPRLHQEGIKVAMVAVPGTHAQEVADQLVEAGVKAILNYAPINLNVPSDVHVQYIDPVIHLQRMTFYLD
jgi:redox-sensing transcriptional repressor